eukprot:GHVQ01008430.1.p1 GENE.GHVQ01008430.1~~GHVQ01008430.1.p1  ORF type:complete len:536 (-),score=38.97 GHVQ01008430.1:4102-5709(-)
MSRNERSVLEDRSCIPVLLPHEFFNAVPARSPSPSGQCPTVWSLMTHLLQNIAGSAPHTWNGESEMTGGSETVDGDKDTRVHHKPVVCAKSLQRFLMALQETKSGVTAIDGATYKVDPMFNHLPRYFNQLPLSLTTTFFLSALPLMAQAILTVLPTLSGVTDLDGPTKTALVILEVGSSATVTINELQCFSLLSAGFFVLYPLSKDKRFVKPSSSSMKVSLRSTAPGVNFTHFYSGKDRLDQVSKLECFVRYFVVQARALRSHIEQRFDQGNLRTLLFQRLQCHFLIGACELADGKSSLSLEWWLARTEQLGSKRTLKIFDGKNRIEDSPFLQADFANKSIGGGVLEIGCVQEEILFATRTELTVSRLFFDTLEKSEAARMSGFIPFCTHVGYAYQFRCTGDYSPRESTTRPRSVVCLDAENFQGCDNSIQFHPWHILRELNKLHAALHIEDDCPASSDLSGMPFATGNWGCGAFGGDVQLKFVMQWMAATVCGRDLHFYSFNHQALTGLHVFSDVVANKRPSVGQIVGLLVRVC